MKVETPAGLTEDLRETQPPPAQGPPGPAAPAPDELAPPPPDTNRVLIAAVIAIAAGAWMLGGAFEGFLARPLALLAGAGGVAWVWFTGRQGLPAALQYALAPAAFVAGAVAGIVLPNATGVTGTLPELVVRAIRNGGLLEPPVPFDPGWRFIIVVLFVLAGAAAASIATGWGRPGLALLLPVPLVIGGGFIQPKGAEVVSGSVSLVLLVASLMVVYAARLAGESGASRSFELRQALRGAAVLAGVVVALALLNRTNFLFPEAQLSRNLKPQKPQVKPLSAVADRVLFTVRSDQPGPWRLGTLDAYDGEAWLLPPFDTDRFVDVPSDGRIAPGTGESVKAEFTVRGLEGFTLPGMANPTSIEARGTGLAFDPRTQTVRLRKSSSGDGYTYTVTGAAPPSGARLTQAPAALSEDLKTYLEVPEPPTEVRNVLARAPPNPWERLQFMRNTLYEKVVAAGSGVPVDISPERVDVLLRGADATPFEITAAEAMLARWAGVPSRIGYGFYRGKEMPGGWEVHPKDGANWLEANFPGLGWVPIIGVPPKARSSLNDEENNRLVSLNPSDELSLQVYIPIQLEDPLLLYQVVRYWLGVAFPFVVLALLCFAFFPGPLKLYRSHRRRRWAESLGPAEQIAVEYAEFRDLAHDLNAGDPYATPLAFVERIAHDEEHEEFAWLVTRALWGDLGRDLRPEDAQAALEMGRSLRRRLSRGQTATSRVLAVTSRLSLRTPYDASVPNTWPSRRLRLRRPGAARAIAASVLLGMVSCGGPDAPADKARLPDRILPAEVRGLKVAAEPEASKAYKRAGKRSLVATGQVLTMRRDDVVQAALQVGAFKPQFDSDDAEVRRGVRASIENGNYRFFKMDGQWIGEQRLSELSLYLWFPRGGRHYQVLVARPELGIPKDLLRDVLAYQRGDRS
ncbi:MAG TPA: transglutaminaseTgpA domain-containing protein [Actinomycetota bacterium]|nr:transglutaminaseTgpA domain-containing protein [Actinomycetota bacterium]